MKRLGVGAAKPHDGLTNEELNLQRLLIIPKDYSEGFTYGFVC